uniref:Uncharacterized protein n=1 Tax=Kalanchoe fedtschenkoi TaxID=63787 RepID=A0A7N0RD85_KALFE
MEEKKDRKKLEECHSVRKRVPVCRTRRSGRLCLPFSLGEGGFVHLNGTRAGVGIWKTTRFREQERQQKRLGSFARDRSTCGLAAPVSQLYSVIRQTRRLTDIDNQEWRFR